MPELVTYVCEKLVNVFGTLTIAEVLGEHSNRLLEEFGAASLADLSAVRGYDYAFTETQKAKGVLEEIGAHDTMNIQVKTCFRTLNALRTNYKFDLFTKIYLPLVERWFLQSGRWDQTTQNFDLIGKEYVVEWKDLFLPYTNYGMPQTNNDYAELIDHVFGTFFRSQRSEPPYRNCVAALIQKQLSKVGLQGFFDEYNVTCGDEIEYKIYDYCHKAYAMIQFIENASFAVRAGPRGNVNWCWEEYNAFCNTRDALVSKLGQKWTNYFVITVLIGDTHELTDTDDAIDHQPWITEINALHPYRLNKEKINAWNLVPEFRKNKNSIKLKRDHFIDLILLE